LIVHGIPETSAVRTPLLSVLGRDAVAIALLGFAVPWPERFRGTKDVYAEWLREALASFDALVDGVGHDLGTAREGLALA
jgi:pimeloyl-ACP methyl ester carboxylesterase